METHGNPSTSTDEGGLGLPGRGHYVGGGGACLLACRDDVAGLLLKPVKAGLIQAV